MRKQAARYASQPTIDVRGGVQGMGMMGGQNNFSAIFPFTPGTNFQQAAAAARNNPNPVAHPKMPQIGRATAQGVQQAQQKAGKAHADGLVWYKRASNAYAAGLGVTSRAQVRSTVDMLLGRNTSFGDTKKYGWRKEGGYSRMLSSLTKLANVSPAGPPIPPDGLMPPPGMPIDPMMMGGGMPLMGPLPPVDPTTGQPIAPPMGTPPAPPLPSNPRPNPPRPRTSEEAMQEARWLQLLEQKEQASEPQNEAQATEDINDQLMGMGGKTASVFKNAFEKGAELEIGRASWPERFLTNTVGRVGSILSGAPIITTDMLRDPTYGDREKEHIRTAKLMESVRPDQLGDVKLRLGGTNVFDDLKRVWTNKRTGPLGKVLGTIGTPVGALQTMLLRGPHYNPYSNTVIQTSNSRPITEHELGHAIDFNEVVGKKPASNWLLRQLQGTGRDLYGMAYNIPYVNLWHEAQANRKSRKALEDALKNNPHELEQRKIDRTRVLPAAYSTYVTSNLGLGPVGVLGGAAATKFVSDVIADVLQDQFDNEKKLKEKGDRKEEKEKAAFDKLAVFGKAWSRLGPGLSAQPAALPMNAQGVIRPPVPNVPVARNKMTMQRQMPMNPMVPPGMGFTRYAMDKKAVITPLLSGIGRAAGYGVGGDRGAAIGSVALPLSYNAATTLPLALALLHPRLRASLSNATANARGDLRAAIKSYISNGHQGSPWNVAKAGMGVGRDAIKHVATDPIMRRIRVGSAGAGLVGGSAIGNAMYGGTKQSSDLSPFARAFFDRCDKSGFTDEQVRQGIEKLASQFPEAIGELREGLEKRANPLVQQLGNTIRNPGARQMLGNAWNWASRLWRGGGQPAATNAAYGGNVARFAPTSSNPVVQRAFDLIQRNPGMTREQALAVARKSQAAQIGQRWTANRRTIRSHALSSGGGALAGGLTGDPNDPDAWRVGGFAFDPYRAAMGAAAFNPALRGSGASTQGWRGMASIPAAGFRHSIMGSVAGTGVDTGLDAIGIDTGGAGRRWGSAIGWGTGMGMRGGQVLRNNFAPGTWQHSIGTMSQRLGTESAQGVRDFMRGAVYEPFNLITSPIRGVWNISRGRNWSALGNRINALNPGRTPSMAHTAGRWFGFGTGGAGALYGGAQLANSLIGDAARQHAAQMYNEIMPQFQEDMAGMANNYLDQLGLRQQDGQLNLGNAISGANMLQEFSNKADNIFRSIGINPSRMSPFQKLMILGGVMGMGGGMASGNGVMTGASGAAMLAGLLPQMMGDRGQGQQAGSPGISQNAAGYAPFVSGVAPVNTSPYRNEFLHQVQMQGGGAPQ